MRRKFSDRDAQLLSQIFVEDELYHGVFGRLCETLLTRGDVVFLGGRSVQVALELARRVGPDGRLIVVEAVADEARRLADDLAAAGQADVCQIFNATLYHERGKLAFLQLRGQDPAPVQAAPAAAQPAPPPPATPPRPIIPPVPIPWHYEPDIEILRADALLIDDFLDYDRGAAFIRLDLEGAEFPAILGGERTLRRSQPVVLFEHGGGASAARHGYDAAGFFAFFDSVDYRLIDLYGRPFIAADWDRMPAPWRLLALPRGSRREAQAADAVYGVVHRMARRRRRRDLYRWMLR